MAFFAALPPGTTVIATEDFGPVICGQPGIVIGHAATGRRRWHRRTYVCTFLGGITVMAAPGTIAAQDHGCSRQMLEDEQWFFHTRTPQDTRDAAELRRTNHSPG